LIAFGAVLLWYFGLVDAVLETEHTRISVLIMVIFILGSLHCLYQTIAVSRELVVTRKVREAIESSSGRPLVVTNDGIVTDQGRTLEPGVVTTHIANIIAKARNLRGGILDQTVLLRSLADKLRAREKLGLFVSE